MFRGNNLKYNSKEIKIKMTCQFMVYFQPSFISRIRGNNYYDLCLSDLQSYDTVLGQN